jgi:hypothetical protein
MDIYLLVDGSRVAAEMSDQRQFAFRLRMPAQEIRLMSGYASPADLATSDDRRRLGVALQGLRWQQGENVIEPSIISPAFMDGFHNLEYYNADDGPFRWTNGNAALPPGLIPDWRGETLLVLRLSLWEGSTVHTSPNPDAALLGAFENLGDNCDLALAQQHYGVELPMTLLRWAGTSYEKLLRGLETGFHGLGDPAHTEVMWVSGDYRLRTPYLSFHTAASNPHDEAGIAEILGFGCATLRLLRRKLLKDIADARRIFVFKTTDPSFGQTEMHRLHDALRAIGPASLLCVTLTKPGQPGGHVERLVSGLYAGSLERFVIPDGPCDGWLKLCTRTMALHAPVEKRS